VVAGHPDDESGGAPQGRAAPPESDLPPETVEEWFEIVAERVERGDALAEPSSLLDAASAVEGAESLATVERLVEQLEDDVDALRRVERHAAALAERASDAAGKIPLESFRRLS
jgi:DNA-binding ferritin-like protein